MVNSEIIGYARPELLVETEWLEAHLDDSGLRVIDCDLPEAFSRVHIPGALSVADHYEKDPDTNGVHVMKPNQIAELMGGLGIDKDTLVVGYDSRAGVYSTRLWWVLNYFGHTKVKVLNGGWRKWFSEGRPVTDKVTSVAHSTFVPKEDLSFLATLNDVFESIGKENHIIWDVRSLDEYTGREERDNKRPGHVKGAIHLEWSNTVNDDSTFKDASSLRVVMDTLEITPEKTVITH